VTPTCTARLKAWFCDYTRPFLNGDPDHRFAIQLKIDHTERVCQEASDLARALGLSQKDRMLAEIIALFHDIGRFKQYKKYQTFRDCDSENHAKLGVRELIRNGVLAGFSSGERRDITRAIAFHNAALLPTCTNDTTGTLMRLIRDADKLDIWRIVCGRLRRNEVDAPHPNGPLWSHQSDVPCSPKVLESYRTRRFVYLEDVRHLNDYKLLAISWIYDLNFACTLKTVASRGHIETITAGLPDTGEIRVFADETLDYLHRMAGFSPGSQILETPEFRRELSIPSAS
jgi:putative nucleotidyltransferase with HDIG domain